MASTVKKKLSIEDHRRLADAIKIINDSMCSIHVLVGNSYPRRSEAWKLVERLNKQIYLLNDGDLSKLSSILSNEAYEAYGEDTY